MYLKAMPDVGEVRFFEVTDGSIATGSFVVTGTKDHDFTRLLDRIDCGINVEQFVLGFHSEYPTGFVGDNKAEKEPFWHINYARWPQHGGLDRVLFCTGSLYILSNDGKTIDRVR